MKTNYYVIILDQNNNLCVDSLGSFLNVAGSVLPASICASFRPSSTAASKSALSISRQQS